VAPFGLTGTPSKADVPYGSEPLQTLDLYLPDGAVAAPMLLFVHGGGWSTGDKSDLAWLGQQLARQGVLVALPNYRLSPAVQHPTHAQDVARAVAWFYRNGASYGGDPRHLYLAGHSAGAHLASLVALDPTYLAAAGLNAGALRGVAGISGAGYDLDAQYASTPMAPVFYSVFGSDTSRWANAAPLHYVQPYAPPFLLVHGLDDTQAPATSTETFATALQAQGVPMELDLMPGKEHGTALIASVGHLREWITQRDAPPPTVRATATTGGAVTP
jgi:acetyl esterase/lipase